MRVLRKSSLLLVGLLLSFSSICLSQEYTLRDQAEIAYQAQLTLSMYKDLLNVISYEGLATESEIKELIRNSYTDSPSQIFYSGNAIIEDDIKPSNLDARLEQDKTIKSYLNYFDLAYVKSARESVDFYDFQVSNLKYRNFLYIKVKFTSHFKGKHKEDPKPYKAVDRLAEFRVVKKNNEWKTFITSIVYYNPENPVTSTEGDVKLDKSVKDDGTFSSLRGKINPGSRSGANENAQADASAGKSEEQDSVFNYHLQAGRAALVAEKLDEAFSAFSEAEKIYPSHQELRKSLMELTKAQNLKISSAESRFENAKINADRALSARDYVKAKALYSEALRFKPDEDGLKVSIEKLERIIQKLALPESKFAVGEYKEAIKDYSRAIKGEKGNADYYFGRGKSYEKLKDFKKAFRDYSKAIELDGNFIEALSQRAQLYAETEQYHQAIADYTLILSNPDFAPAFYSKRAEVKEMAGDLDGAMEDYSTAIQLNPLVAVYDYRKGMILLSLKKPELAVSAFSEAIRKNPELVEAYYQRGFANAAMGNGEAAASDFAKARAFGLEEAELTKIQKLSLQYYHLGEGEIEKEKYDSAVKAFENALFITPDFGRAWLRKGDAYFMLQEYDSAISQYNQAVQYDRVSVALFRRALAFQQKQEEEAALQDFRKYIPIGQEVVRKAEEAGKKKSPSDLLLTGFMEERADAWYALGYSHLMAEEFKDALESLDMAIDNRKFFPKAYFAKGSALFALKDYKKAVKNMEESIMQGLSDPFVFYSLGKAYVANGQLEDAILSYSHTIKLDDEYVEAYKERAICYKNTRRYKLALADIKTALKLNENLEEDVRFMTHKGLLELYQHNVQDAKQSFEQALSLKSNDAWALYGKASALAQEQKIQESLELYRKAFQTRQIEWSSIKKDPLIAPVSKHKEFKKLVKSYL